MTSVRYYAPGPGGSDVGSTAGSKGFKDREQVSCLVLGKGSHFHWENWLKSDPVLKYTSFVFYRVKSVNTSNELNRRSSRSVSNILSAIQHHLLILVVPIH